MWYFRIRVRNKKAKKEKKEKQIHTKRLQQPHKNNPKQKRKNIPTISWVLAGSSQIEQ